MRRREWLLVGPCVALLSVAPQLTLAADDDHRVTVRDAWIRESPPGVDMTAGYMSMRNNGTRQQVLIGASSAGFGEVMIHRTTEKDGMAAMMHTSQIELAPNASVAFAPGGLHLMLMNPTQALRVGDRVNINLQFQGGLVVPFAFEVRK